MTKVLLSGRLEHLGSGRVERDLSRHLLLGHVERRLVSSVATSTLDRAWHNGCSCIWHVSRILLELARINTWVSLKNFLDLFEIRVSFVSGL